MSDSICCVCGGPVVRGHHRISHGYGGPQHESAQDCVAHARSLLTAAETALASERAAREALDAKWLADMSEARAQVEDLGERLAAERAEVARLTRELEEERRSVAEAREVATRNAKDCEHLRQSAIALERERDEARADAERAIRIHPPAKRSDETGVF